MNEKKTYNLNEVAKELNVSRRTIERWIASGELESIRYGHTRRVRTEVLEKKSDNYRQFPSISAKTSR